MAPPLIPHRFRPNPLRPIECALCGNRESAHQPKKGKK